MVQHVLAFAVLVALLTLTPGADTALVTGATLRHGRRAAFFTTLGVSGGLFVHAAASAVGLSLLLARSAEAYALLKLAGAAYLCWLGAKALWDARKRREAVDAGAREPMRDGAAFRRGILTNVLNPKVAVFYLTFLPQFIEPGDPVLVVSLALAAIHVALGVVWLSTCAWLLDRAGRAVATPRFQQWTQRVTGAVLVAFGVRLALSEAPRAA